MGNGTGVDAIIDWFRHADVPILGNLLICTILVSSAYTFAMGIAAARGRPHLVPAARWGMLATIAIVVSAVFLLAYAFQAHDFRLRYVALVSDRSMPWWYLWTALWGGQDGSLLWWSFLLGMYSLGFTLWVGRRYLELQPWIYATLSVIFGFFAVLMLFAANPFSTTFGPAPADGQGLNPLLQNYWMAIHPPALYLGLTGWSVPFAIAVAALMTGRLGDEWILMVRRWVLLAWAFLSLGNLLGMFWSYEELGWGGYWAWDPVENASFMPWLLGTGFVHSVMIQERRGMMKVMNIALICATFWFTIFGTFLTRSGLIASVHSFARSDIGIYFVWFMIALAIFLIALISWRLPELRGGRPFNLDSALYGLLFGGPLGILLVSWGKLVQEVHPRGHKIKSGNAPKIESLLSREFAFFFNNWILIGMLIFILIATTFPLISEALRDQTVTVGPGYYNRWMVPLGLILLFLMGVGPLIAWRKATGKNLMQAFVWPLVLGTIAFILHLALGTSLGFPPVVQSEEIYETTTGAVLAAIYSASPIMSTTLCAFVVGTIAQEFVRGIAMRRRNAKEGVLTALTQLVSRARRRYGGYLVHLGIVFLYLGFTGSAWDEEREAALRPDETMSIGAYQFRYLRSYDEVDITKRMLFADVEVLHDGERLAVLHPAKFVYRSHPDMPTSEVAIRSTPLNDIYVILSTVDMETQRATFRVVVRPLVWWVWFGGAVLLFGAFIAAFPSMREMMRESEDRARSRGRLVPATAAVLLVAGLGGAMLLTPLRAHGQADSTSSLHAGTVEIHDPAERRIFERLLCMCEGCQRLPLDVCGCSWAEEKRAEIRTQIGRGRTLTEIQDLYREEFGPRAIAIPSDSGLERALWAVPVIAIAAGLAGIIAIGRSWTRRTTAPTTGAVATPEASAEYDRKLDDELRNLEEP